MSNLSFQSCSINYSHLLGRDCADLGVGKNFGFNYHKVFMSYDPSKGWSVVKLNIFQLFLRNVCGCYRSTHLSFVFKSWIELDRKENFTSLDQRIQTIWFRSYLSYFGNTDFKDAQVICFPNRHNDILYRKTVALFINRHCQKQDMMLIEGLEVGRRISLISWLDHVGFREFPLLNFVKQAPEILGWEPSNLQCLASRQQSDEMWDRLFKLKKICKEIIRKDKFSEQDLLLFKKLIEDVFYPEYEQLACYYKMGENEVLLLEQVKKIINDAFAYVENNPDINQGDYFEDKINEILNPLKSNSQTAFSRSVVSNRRDLQKCVEQMTARNASLREEIKKYSQPGRKVYVIAGAAHLLKLKRTSPLTIESRTGLSVRIDSELEETLYQQKLITIVSQKSLKNFGFTPLHPPLRTI